MVSTSNLQQVWKPDLLTKLYVFSLCLLIYAVAEVSWLKSIPRQPLYILVSVIALIKMAQKGASFSKGRIGFILVWFIYCMMTIMVNRGTIFFALFYILLFFVMSSVAMLTVDEMKYLLKVITNCFVVILIISLFGWILYLIGFPLSYTGPIYHSNGYHIYYDYYFFTTQANLGGDYERFSSVFLEPGQMATPCAFLFHLNTRNDRIFRFRNVIMLVAIIMSLSLIAYGLLLFSIVANQLTRSNSRYKIPIMVVTLSLLGGLYLYFSTNENTAIYARIISRLEYDEESNTISGYNRTGDNFEIHYANLMRSSAKYFGARDQLTQGDNWTVQASGYKKFIVHHGIVGFSLVLLMMFVMLLNNKSLASFAFFTLVVVAFLVRDLLTSPLWLTTAIIGMYIIGSEAVTNVNNRKPIQIQTTSSLTL